MKLENGQILDIVFIISLVTLYFAKMYSYLLFHSLVEIFSIVIALVLVKLYPLTIYKRQNSIEIKVIGRKIGGHYGFQ
jgi:high-affinity K+ transport system ATPase subunit B